MARTKTSQRYAAGEKGRNRVGVFPDPKTGMFQIEYRRNGRREARSLKHRDFEKAKEQADKLAANFPSAEPEPEANREPEPLTLGRLFEMYLGEVTPRKSDGVEKFDRAAATRILKCLGTSREPSQLSRREWDLFITARQSARLTGRKVGPRTVGRDLKFLHAVLNWATLVSDGQGGVLLDRNPLRGLSIPSEKNPMRPIVGDDEYRALLGVSDQVSPLLRTLLVVAHETGHRIGAIRRLQWSDLDLEGALIVWRAENDKCGFEHVTPVSSKGVAALERHLRRFPGIGTSWVFPGPRDASEPISRHLVRDWWERAETLAELERIEGRGWHSLRRKFASDLMHEPLKVLGELGGWRRMETIVECYQRPDQDQLREALRTRARVSNGHE